MKWNDIKVKKPDHDMICYVCNNRWGGAFIASYITGYNVFVEAAPHKYPQSCIDITHWVELPPLPPLIEKGKCD